MFQDYGLIQMLQSQLMNLISTAVALTLLVLIGRWLIGTLQPETGETDSRPLMKRWLNILAFIIFVISVVGFMLSAGSIALKEIPRTGFDRGAVIEDGSTTKEGN